MQCYTTEKLEKKDFTVHILSTKRCTESMKDKIITQFFSNFRTAQI